MSTLLPRRTLLRRGGVCLALPLLESFPPVARAAAAPRKPVRRFVCLSNNYGVYPQAFFPTKGGRDYEMPPTLKALEPHRADFTVFSNLDHGLQGGHACVPSLLSGVMPVVAANYPEMNMSLDQKLAEYVGAATRFPSMALRVNDANLISFTRTGVQVPAISPCSRRSPIRSTAEPCWTTPPSSTAAAWPPASTPPATCPCSSRAGGSDWANTACCPRARWAQDYRHRGFETNAVEQRRPDRPPPGQEHAGLCLRPQAGAL